MTGSPQLGDDLALCNVSVASLPLEAVIPAAAAAGFTSMSVLARAHRRALRNGVTNAELRSRLDDSGLVVSEIEAVGDWLGVTPPGPEWLDAVYSAEQQLELATALGASTVVAVHFGPPAPLAHAGEAFARLCDAAAERGLRVALEFPAIATIADVVTAWDVVRMADRPNGGILLDIWHHRRSGATDEDLGAVPAEKIFSVQLSDATAQPQGPLMEDIMSRRLPGDGQFGVAVWLAALAARGVRGPVGIEVLHADIVKLGPDEATRHLYRSLVSCVDAARMISIIS